METVERNIVPLYRLNKRQGKALLKELNCPEHLYLKKPTADLEEDRPALADEVALGVTYDNIDDYLEGREVPEEAKLGRVDLRHLPLVTIDGESARDFDDAVFAQKRK